MLIDQVGEQRLVNVRVRRDGLEQAGRKPDATAATVCSVKALMATSPPTRMPPLGS
jgi:hypothetical protein